MSLLQTWDGSTELSIREWTQPGFKHKPPTALADAVGALFRNRKWILIALAIFIAGVTALLLLTPRTYESRITYLVRGEGAALPVTSFDGQGMAAALASEQTTDVQIGTEVELLSNTELHRNVLAKLEPKTKSAEVEKQLTSFAKHLKVLPVPKSTLISVTYTGRSKQAAVETLAALNSEYLATRASIRGSEKAFRFFDSEANRYYHELQADQAHLAAFEKENQVTLLDEEKDLVTRRLSDTQALLNENESAQIDSSRKLAKMAVVGQSLPGRIETQKRELPDQISEGHLNSLLIDLQNKRQELLTKYHETDRHVQEVDQQILNTRQSLEHVRATKSTEVLSDVNPIKASVDSDLEHLKIQAAGLQGRHKVLQTQISDYQSELQRLDQITAEHDDLVRSIKQNEANYELYSKRREEARIDQTLDGSKIANVALVSGPAIEPEPLVPRILAIASVYSIGGIFIIGFGVAMGLWSPRFHTPWEVETAANAPVLATLPLLKTEPKQRAASGERKEDLIGSRTPEVGIHLDLNGASKSASGLILPASRSSALLFGPGDGRYSALIDRLRRTCSSRPGGLAFAVTSSTAGEGVSHIVRGLSDELQSYTGKRVAVVSAPHGGDRSATCILSVPGEFQNGFQESGEEALRNWFRQLRETNDYVLIDCPSMQESRAAVTFGRESDGVLMVVGAGEATRTQLRGSMAALSIAAIPLLGIAMNKRTYPVPDFIYRLL